MNDDQRKFLEFWRDNDEKISNIQSMCDWLRQELRAKEKAQAHINQCQELLKGQNPSYGGLFRSWIYKDHVAVFDLADNGNIDQCGVFLDVEFHPLRVSQILGKRRGVEPKTLAAHVSERYDIDFKPGEAEGHLPGRQVFHDERSPFEKEVRAAAVENSVKILKTLADIRLSE